MKAIIALAAIALLAGACSSSPTADVATFTVDGLVHAGPTCPAMQEPPDPACADTAVADAEIVLLDTAGVEVARVTTDRDGQFQIDLPAGSYTVVPQPVDGLLGTAGELDFSLPGTDELDIAYDTGIR